MERSLLLQCRDLGCHSTSASVSGFRWLSAAFRGLLSPHYANWDWEASA
ncbi:hypothetical protein BAG01nite_48280 [Brevibacillus agri]|uniref:Uncharacterized protein n=1 Tax=Brevibacillus agri TaxID=51101 RepID=A0ABQ0SY20_9BACL|nr:hypothetical protein BAG01nite_48280 [Brevibacillus agri]